MKNNRTSPRLPLGGLRKTLGGAVRTILPTVSALLALLLPTACSEDAIEPAIDFSSPYVLTDDPTDAVRHACYEIYRQYGMVEGNRVDVTVGEVEHPMLEAHYIEWITIQTKDGTQKKKLKPGDAPKASFLLREDDELVAVYAYCNLHGLWKNS